MRRAELRADRGSWVVAEDDGERGPLPPGDSGVGLGGRELPVRKKGVGVIARLVQTSPDRVREMIHRFNEMGMDSLDPPGRVDVPAG